MLSACAASGIELTSCLREGDTHTGAWIFRAGGVVDHRAKLVAAFHSRSSLYAVPILMPAANHPHNATSTASRHSATLFGVDSARVIFSLQAHSLQLPITKTCNVTTASRNRLSNSSSLTRPRILDSPTACDALALRPRGTTSTKA